MVEVKLGVEENYLRSFESFIKLSGLYNSASLSWQYTAIYKRIIVLVTDVTHTNKKSIVSCWLLPITHYPLPTLTDQLVRNIS